MITIKEVEEKYSKFSNVEKNEFTKHYADENVQVVKSPAVYELLQEVLNEEKIIIKGDEMSKEIIEGKVKEEEAQVGEIAKKGGALAETGKALLVKKELTLEEWEKTVKFLYASGYFVGLANPSQALAKAQCGRELGFTPFYSLQHIFIVPGKAPAVDGQAMGALIKNRGYNYRAVETTAKVCTIKFFGRQGEEIGVSSFIIQEADKIIDSNGKALSSKKVWKDYTQDMLWWRCLSRGARRFCPDAISGVYYIEELDYEMKDGEVESDISAFKVEVPKVQEVLSPAQAPQVEKTRKDILEELVEKHTREKIVALKTEMKIDKSLLEISDKEWGLFVEKLSGVSKAKEEPKAEEVKEKPVEKKEVGVKKEEPVKEEPKDELSREEKLGILEILKATYGASKMKEVKENLKIMIKLVDLDDKWFKKFQKAMSKEEKI